MFIPIRGNDPIWLCSVFQMGWFNYQLTSWDAFLFEFRIGFVIWDRFWCDCRKMTDGIWKRWIVLRLEMGLSKTTISRLYFSPCASNFWYLGTGYSLNLYVSLSFFWTKVHESSGVFLHRRASTSLVCSLWTCDGTSLGVSWYDGPTQRSLMPFEKNTSGSVAVVTIWEPLFIVFLVSSFMNVGRWSQPVVNVKVVSNEWLHPFSQWTVTQMKPGKRFGQLHGGIDPHPIGNDHKMSTWKKE